MISICVSVIFFRGRKFCAIRGVASRSKKSINVLIVFIRKYVSDTHRKTRVRLADLKQFKQRSRAFDYLNDSLHPGPGFRSVIRRPFIEDGAHSFTVESQPESVLRRKLGNLRFSILIV